MPQQLPALLFAFLPNDSHYMWVIVGVIVGAHQQLPAHRFPFPANVSHTMRVIVGVIVGKHTWLAPTLPAFGIHGLSAAFPNAQPYIEQREVAAPKP